MIHHYFKIAYRNLIRQKFYSLINIFGLALGLTCTVLIGLYIQYETNYDSEHPDVERLFRVNQTNIWYPDQGAMSSTGLPLAKILTDDYPEIEASLRINTPYQFTVRYRDNSGNVKAFNESDFLAADSNFFEFFKFDLKEGNPATALHGLNKVVISDEASKRLFGDEPALGKVILMGENRTPLEITGVTETQPPNIHFDFDYLISMYTNPNIERFEWSWIWTQAVTYVKLREDADPQALEEKIQKIADLHVAPSFKNFGIDYSEFMKGKDWGFYLQPVKDIHLYSAEAGNRIGDTGDIRYIYIFGVIGMFILMIAIINFVNLTTARAGVRAKEIGVKKAMGSQKSILVRQFLAESILITFISLCIGLALMELVRLLITQFLLIPMPFTLWENTWVLLLLPLLTIIVGVGAGSYPAFFLTKFSPGEILKRKQGLDSNKSKLRNLLVIFQFTISLTLIAATLIISSQVNFMLNKDLGYDKENLFIINNSEKLGDQLESFVQELKTESLVKDASLSMLRPSRGGWEDIFSFQGFEEKFPMSMEKVDPKYFSMLNLEFVAGRPFDENSVADRSAVIINEKAAEMLGVKPEEALSVKMGDMGDAIGEVQVIGVVKDFHFQPLQNSIGPLLIFHEESLMWGDMRVVIIRYNSSQKSQLVNLLQTKWNRLLSETPLEYEFLDETLAEQYDSERRLGRLFTLFTSLSIVIAVIGLIGLVAYASEQRKKEIGIRKVLGAPIYQLLIMLNTHYLKLIAVGLILSVPVAFFLMNNWLQDFPYRVQISPWIFVVSGGMVSLLALLCVSYLSGKAASINPVDVLKEE